MEKYTNEYIRTMESSGYTLVTPDKASEWLQKNTNNRKIRKSFINLLIKKIQNDQWQKDIPDHIAFYEDGTLANGQHRLTAIAQAGVPVFTKIDYNIPKDASVCIDTGKSRTVEDNIKIVTGTDYYTQKITKMISITTSNSKLLSHEDHLKIAQEYKNEILFVRNLFYSTPAWLNQPPIIGAVYLYYLQNHKRDMLMDFVDILKTGNFNPNRPGDITAARYRDTLMMSYIGKSKSNRCSYADELKRAENVIDHYMKNSKITQFRVPDNYKIPLYKYDFLNK